jgi:cardiolipin synthase A/B
LKLLVQPGSGTAPLVEGINRARGTVQIVIFRFDRRDIEKALIAAAKRGVAVHALIAYTNRGGEKHLRALEMRLLASGVTVARTADDLVRYHAKMIIVDKHELYVLGFNFALTDIEHSRSFGVITTNPKFVREAVKLFEADMKRQEYESGLPAFVVSPVNARKELSAFIKGAKHGLLIYDPKIADPAMIRLLEERAAAGVEIRIIGRLDRKTTKLQCRKLPIRLHTRTMLRDGKSIFIGSQSLRTAELDARREVGIIFTDAKCVKQLSETFESDWGAEEGVEPTDSAGAYATAKVAKKVAKAVNKSLRPVAPDLAEVIKEAMGDSTGGNMKDLEDNIRETVNDAVKEAVQSAVDEHLENNKPVA